VLEVLVRLIDAEFIQGVSVGFEFVDDKSSGLNYIILDLFIIRFYIYKGIEDENRSDRQ
jgi:hypothetical protein